MSDKEFVLEEAHRLILASVRETVENKYRKVQDSTHYIRMVKYFMKKQ